MHPLVRALDDVFAGVPHVMFCVKSADGRYLAINQAFAERAGASAARVLGSTAHDLFPADLADGYQEQDDRLLASGVAIRNELEMILLRDGGRGWYVTTKTRLDDTDGNVIGIVAVSYDLRAPAAIDRRHSQLQAAVDEVRRRFAEPLRVADISAAAGLTTAQLDRAMRRSLGMSPKQLLMRTRLDEAIHLLDDTALPIATIADRCGFYDQSQFTRQFRGAVGMAPGAYRARVPRPGAEPPLRSLG